MEVRIPMKKAREEALFEQTYNHLIVDNLF